MRKPSDPHNKPGRVPKAAKADGASAAASWGAHLQQKGPDAPGSGAAPKRRAPVRPVKAIPAPSSPPQQRDELAAKGGQKRGRVEPSGFGEAPKAQPPSPTPRRPQRGPAGGGDDLAAGMLGQAQRKLDRRARHPKRAIPITEAEAQPAANVAAKAAAESRPAKAASKLKRRRVAVPYPILPTVIIAALYAVVAFGPLLLGGEDNNDLARAYEIAQEEMARVNNKPKLGLWLESKNLTKLQGIQRESKTSILKKLKAAGMDKVGTSQIRFRLRQGALLVTIHLSEEQQFTLNTQGEYVGRGAPPTEIIEASGLSDLLPLKTAIAAALLLIFWGRWLLKSQGG